jgi:fibronectin-binding autotransporter adhesin
LAANGSSVQVSFNTAGNLPVGAYQLQIDNANVQDLIGNAVGTGVSTTHFNVQSFSDIWIGSQSGGVWSDASNWSAGRVPNATDSVLINSVSGGLIFMNSTDQVASLTQIGSGTLTVTEGGSLTVAGEADLEGTLNVVTGSTFNADGAATLGSLLLAGGTLGGTGTVNVTGSATVAGGLMVGPGTTITQGALTIEGLGLAGRTLQALGTTNWTSGNITGGGLFDNQGTLNVNVNAIANASVNANAEEVDADTPFTNEGSVVIGSGSSLVLGSGTQSGSFSGSGNLTFSGGRLNLTATSSVAVGSLTLQDLNATLGGSITVGSGDQLIVDNTMATAGGGISVTGSIAGAGDVQVSGGLFAAGATSTFAVTGTTTVNNATISFAGPVTLGTLDLAGSTLTGSGTVTVNGATTLADAVLSGSGKTIAQGGLTIDGTGVTLSGGYVLENQGVANWTSGSIQFSGGASAPALDGMFRNDAGAVFNANIANLSGGAVPDGSIVSADGPATGLFDNEGTFNQLGNVGTRCAWRSPTTAACPSPTAR